MIKYNSEKDKTLLSNTIASATEITFIRDNELKFYLPLTDNTHILFTQMYDQELRMNYTRVEFKRLYMVAPINNKPLYVTEATFNFPGTYLINAARERYLALETAKNNTTEIQQYLKTEFVKTK